MNRELIWVFIICLCNNFFVICAFYLCLKSNRYVYRKLVLKFVADESGLHSGYVVINYNILNLCLVDNSIVCFWRRLL